MYRKGIASACFGVGLFVSSAAMAETYQYTGLDFASVSGLPFTLSESVSGTFTTSTPLPDNEVNNLGFLMPLSYSFTDGVQTLTNTNSSASFQIFDTNASGVPIGWSITITATSCPRLGSSGLCEIETNTNVDFAEFANDFTDGEAQAHTFSPGTFTDITATPLPATLPLFAGGLGFVGYLSRRRKRGGKQALTVS